MIDKIDYKITQESHPLLYFNWLKLKPSKRFKLYLKLNTVNQRLEKSTQKSNVKLTVASNCIIGSIGGQTLGNAFTMMPNLIELDLIIQKGNQLGDLGFEGIIKGLTKQQLLKKLKLCICRNNSINNEGLKLFSKHLETLTQLEYFRFQLFNNNVDSQSSLALYSSIAKISSLQTLKLYLVNVKMNVEEIEFVGENIKQLKNLTNLHLSLNYEEDIESKALLFLSLGLSSLSNLNRLSLNFITINFGKNAVQYLFNQGIAKLSLLRCIKIQFSRKASKITLNGNICQGFSKLSLLQHLDVDIPYKLADPTNTVSNMIEELKHCQEITKLCLNIESLETLSLVGILNYLKKLTSSSLILSKGQYLQSGSRNLITSKVLSITFTDNSIDISKRWFEILFDGYKHFTSIKQFTFEFSHYNKFGNEGAIILSQNLSFFLELRYLKIQFQMNSGLLPEGMIKMSQSFKKLINLDQLDLEINERIQIGQESILILFSSLKQMNQLKHLTLIIYCQNEAFNYDITPIETKMQNLSSLTQLESLYLSLYPKDIDLNASLALQNWISSLEQLQNLEIELKEFRLFELDEQDIVNYCNIVKGIQQLTNLKKIYFKSLNEYQITGALSQIQDELQLFPNLIELRIDHYSTSHIIFEQLSSYLCQLPHLQILIINIQKDWRNKIINLKDTQQIQKCFPYLKKLREMSFITNGDMKINPKTIREFALSFSLLNTLNKLFFRNESDKLDNIIFHQIAKRKCKRLVITSHIGIYKLFMNICF